MFLKDFVYICLSWPAALEHGKVEETSVNSGVFIQATLAPPPMWGYLGIIRNYSNPMAHNQGIVSSMSNHIKNNQVRAPPPFTTKYKLSSNLVFVWHVLIEVVLPQTTRNLVSKDLSKSFNRFLKFIGIFEVLFVPDYQKCVPAMLNPRMCFRYLWISLIIFGILRMSFPKGNRQYNDWMQMKKYEIIKTSRRTHIHNESR